MLMRRLHLSLQTVTSLHKSCCLPVWARTSSQKMRRLWGLQGPLSGLHQVSAGWQACNGSVTMQPMSYVRQQARLLPTLSLHSRLCTATWGQNEALQRSSVACITPAHCSRSVTCLPSVTSIGTHKVNLLCLQASQTGTSSSLALTSAF